jgi:hypothetical protein
MADRTGLPGLPPRLPRLRKQDSTRGGTVSSAALPRIRVTYRRGFRLDAPEHDLNSSRCWCVPLLEEIDDNVYLVTHRAFEN